MSSDYIEGKKRLHSLEQRRQLLPTRQPRRLLPQLVKVGMSESFERVQSFGGCVDEYFGEEINEERIRSRSEDAVERLTTDGGEAMVFVLEERGGRSGSRD